MSDNFKGLIAVVTGAGSGIGLAVAQELTLQGASVFGLDLDKGALDSSIQYLHCDIGNTESVTAAFREIEKQVSHLDVLCNVAGIGAVGSIEEATDEEWSRVMNVNVVGISRVSSAALKLLRKSKNPAIVNTASIAASAGLPKRAVYSASKGAVQSLTLAMAADFVKEGIRVNAVNPGTANTPWVARLIAQTPNPDEHLQQLKARQPMNRLVEASEVASAILYLASPQQASTTGTILAVDGGMFGLRLPK